MIDPLELDRLSTLLAKNKTWANQITVQNPEYFQKLSSGQSPGFTVVSCCDSRADPNTLLQGNLGELFVYKNVANLVGVDDLSLQTALQFSIESLKVRHIVVFGHHNCGGIRLALGAQLQGSPGDWLEGVRELAYDHQMFDDQTASASAGAIDRKVDKLCELNVIQQVRNASQSPAVQAAWIRGEPLAISGLVYCLRTGVVENLNCTISSQDEVDSVCFEAMKAICVRYR